MESEQGLSRETTKEGMKKHFERYGDVVEAMIRRDRQTGRSRGFGFVFYLNSKVTDKVVHEKHTIEGRLVYLLTPLFSAFYEICFA
ncbi:hypothetical protein SUGI_1000880 [Cryptomeria japonica]|nr:hypothetical protein SUGI_1000880 [Cryptomeria japonica]